MTERQPLDYTAVTCVLDLDFENIDRYKEVKSMELTTRSFASESIGFNSALEFVVGNFVCKTVQNEKYPRQFGIICYNDNDSIMRYLYFEEWESPEYAKDKDYIIKCTNCPW